MKILVFSDSHGNLTNVERILRQTDNFDMIYHLGDNVRDALEIKKAVSCPVKYVKGNTDFTKAPLEIIEQINGIKLLLTHGHKHRVKYNLNNLYYAALEKGVNAALFGHTHISHKEKVNGILLFNPGSIGNKRWESKETYGIIDIDEQGNIKADIVEI